MSENSYMFDIPQHHKSIIKVIGVGGGGSNAVNHMHNLGIKDVEFVICNTDSQALNSSPVPTKLQIGINLTNGLGAGANPEKGKSAAIESKEDIRSLLEENTKMVFITAGMGGGTGTGAAPVIAKIAKDMDILSVGIVTVPFAFEGKKKMSLAATGIAELKESCDTVLVISNDKLREIYGNLSISEAFAEADNVLTTAAKGIAEIITVPGYVNVDFEDVKTVMFGAGAAVMGSATTEGDSRARRAAEEAISSPLLNTRDIHGAKKILLSIISGEQAELQMDELSEITEFIQERAGDEAEVIFGHGIDTELGNSIRVTVIATGFDDNYPTEEVEEEKKVFDLETTKQIPLFEGKRESQEIDLNMENPLVEEPTLPEPTPAEELDLAPADEEIPAQASEELIDDTTEEVMDETPEEQVMEPFETPDSETPDMPEFTIENEEQLEEPVAEEPAEAPEEKDDFNRGYFFEPSTQEESALEETPQTPEEDEEFTIVNASNREEIINEEGMLELRKKKETLQQQAKDRVERLRGISGTDIDTDAFKEKLDVPAYLRKNVALDKSPNSKDEHISRFNLNDDNQILGNNRFLHDNVD